MSPLVSFRQVSARIGRKDILYDLSFDVEAGETLVLLGRSGSGKTTALKMVNGLLLPSAGDVLIEGTPTTAWDLIRLRRRIGYVIQDAGLFPHFTVAANVGLVPRLEGRQSHDIDARVQHLLTQVGLPPMQFATRYPRELSGGQRQRVGIARALAADPPLLLLDEPFGALDPVTRVELQQQFLDLRDRLNKTALLVTHDVREALLLGTRIGVLHNGRLVFLGGRSEFLEAARSGSAGLSHVPRGEVEGDDLMSLELARDILDLTLEHLLLVGLSMGIAAALAIPAGILLTRRTFLQRWVLGFSNIMQTVPSLALFGFLIPLPFLGGIGKHTAIVALVLYALLPILRNTLTGILTVDPAVRESAIAMGMTGRQLLWEVELPLATRTIVAGLRIATVTTIGTATIAAAIGGGGLGVFIFRGLASVDTTLLLAGALPAALIALAADRGLEWIEHRLSPV